MEKLILEQITLDELTNTIRSTIKEELPRDHSEEERSLSNAHEQMLSCKEVCQILNVSYPTLNEST